MAGRVVINATSVGRQPDGISVYGIELIRALARASTGLRFEVVLNDDARERLADLSPPPTMELRYASARLSPEHGTSGHLLRSVYANLLALRSRPAVVFAISQIEASLAGGPRAVTVHDVTPLLFKEHHPRQYHFYRRALGPALRATSLVIAPSEATRQALLCHYGLAEDRVRVVPHGPPVPLRTAPPPRNGQRPYVLCIARANPVKNVKGLLAAFHAIEGDCGADLVVAGGANGVSPSSPRVRFMKNVPDSQKLLLLDGASVLVDASFDEGFGFPALEAMARGCPVLAARAGSLPEVCADAALYFDPRDPAHLARVLRRALDDGRLRATLIERGLRRAPGFSWARSAGAHLEVFEELLSGGPARS